MSWTGVTGPASLERRPAGGKYQPLATVKDGATYTDASIDAMTIYQYRVQGPSNEVTAGPPPTGYSVAQATPQAFIEKSHASQFAKSTAMELDANGDPAFLYSVVDPRFADSSDAELWFLHWDRAHWRWKAPVKVADYKVFRDGVSLARDPAAASTWATVAEFEDHLVLLVSTDDGATWTPRHQITRGEQAILGRAIALHGGRVFWTYRAYSQGVYLLSGLLSEEPSRWKAEKAPVPEPMEVGSAASWVTVAADSQGKPGVVYFGYGPDYNVTAFYWRPGDTQPRKIMDSDGVQNDFHTVALTYSGAPKDGPKFLVELNRRKNGSSDPQIWVVRNDGAPLEITGDGGHHSLNAPFGLVFDSAGRGAALITRTGGQGDDRCGYPKLARGAATGPWKTCSPDNARDHDSNNNASDGMTLRLAVNEKLYGGWSQSGAGPGQGVLLWREP